MDEPDLQALAVRHDLPVGAIEALVVALRRGGGRQVQFSHPALGGMGQWSRGGGIMIGDMFDHDLKAKVARVCEELADLVGERSIAGVALGSGTEWWPRGLGHPTAVGSQNEQGYAFFPETRRLAIRDSDGIRLFDTGDRRITGVSQQQSNGRGVPTFRSQHGDVRLDELPTVETEPRPTNDDTAQVDPAPPRSGVADGASEPRDVLSTIERLHELHRKGVLTDSEYADKKKELLARL